MLCVYTIIHMHVCGIVTVFLNYFQAGQKIENLYEDLKDGSKLLLLLELLTNEKLVSIDVIFVLFVYIIIISTILIV